MRSPTDSPSDSRGSLPEPYYADDWVTIYHGDCRELLPVLDADVIVTDPPYGIRWDVGRGNRHHRGAWRDARGMAFPDIIGDDESFDPALLLSLGLPTVLFGANHYADRLPPSPSWLVWDKRLRNGFHNDQADCELAWTNLGGPARMFRKMANGSPGFAEDRVGGYRPHPTTKPLDVMRWVISRCPLGTVLDPYAGSGSTLVAAKAVGRPSVGVEIEERYCEVAANRCRQEVLGLGA